MILDKRAEYLSPHIQSITQAVLEAISANRDRSDLHRAMFNRLADNNFQNNAFQTTLCLAIASIHNLVTKMTSQGQQFNFPELLQNSCRYAVQLMYYNYIVHDNVVATYCDNETRKIAHQYFSQYQEMLGMARGLVSFEDMQRGNFNVGYNNNGNARPIVIGNSNGPIAGGSQFPSLNMGGGHRFMTDTDLSDDLEQLGSTIKKKPAVIDSVVFKPSDYNGFMNTNPAVSVMQPQVVEKPTPVVNAVKELSYTFGDIEMDRTQHRLVVGGNEFVVPVHTNVRLESDIVHSLTPTLKDDTVINDQNAYLKRMHETCTSLTDLITMTKSTHLESLCSDGTKSMVVKYIGSHFDVLPTRTNIKKYYDAISNCNMGVHNLNDHLCKLCNRLNATSSDIDEKEKEDVLTLLLFVDKIATGIVNSQLEFIFGKGNISIDSFIDDWKDLNNIINTDYQARANEFFVAVNIKLKATFLSVELEQYTEDALVYYTHVVSQHAIISLNVNSKYLAFKCDSDWVFVSRQNHPMLHKLIDSCRGLATVSGEFTLHNLIITNDLVVYEIDTTVNNGCWIRLMKI